MRNGDNIQKWGGRGLICNGVSATRHQSCDNPAVTEQHVTTQSTLCGAQTHVEILVQDTDGRHILLAIKTM